MLNHITKSGKVMLCACMLTIGSTSIAQEETSASHKWAVSVNIAPEMAYRHLLTDDPSIQDIISSRNEWEKPMLSFTAGAGVEYALTKRLHIKSGLHYTIKGERGTFPLWTPPTTSPDSNLPTSFEFSYRYHSIGIPLGVSFDFFQREKINLFVSAGVAVNYLHRIVAQSELTLTETGNSVDKNIIDPRDDEFTDYTLFNPSGIVSFGADVYLGERSKLRIEPIFRHSFLPVADTPIREYQFNGGLNVGYLFLL